MTAWIWRTRRPRAAPAAGRRASGSRLAPTDIYRNIVGDSSRTVKEAWEAAEQAGLADDIRQMPMGLDTVVSEGGGAFSGGQSQRLLIARALVGKPRMVLFDEATSALDNKAQAVVTASLDRLDATRIVIAHRFSTIVDADRIIYFDDGMIQEEGTYEELMAKGGKFASWRGVKWPERQPMRLTGACCCAASRASTADRWPDAGRQSGETPGSVTRPRTARVSEPRAPPPADAPPPRSARAPRTFSDPIARLTDVDVAIVHRLIVERSRQRPTDDRSAPAEHEARDRFHVSLVAMRL